MKTPAKNNLTAKVSSVLLIFSFLITPVIAEAIGLVPNLGIFSKDAPSAIPVSDSAQRAKEVGITIPILGITIPGITLDSLMITIAREVVDKMGDEVVEWVSGADDGNPLFVTDPKQFFADIGDAVGGEYIKSLGLGALCEPFRAQVQGALRQELIRSNPTKNRQTPQCTLSDVVGNVDAFFEGDFAQGGGWDTWFRVTQVPQNNPYGAYLENEGILALKISSAQGVKKLETDWAKGFLNIEGDCLEYVEDTVAGTAGGDGDPDYELASQQVCAKRGPTKTPGTVVENQLNKVLGTEVDQLNIADEFDEILGAVIGRLTGQILNNAEGLFKQGGGGWSRTGRGRTEPVNPLGSCRPDKTLAVKGEDKVTWTLFTTASKNATFEWSGDDFFGDNMLGTLALQQDPTKKTKTVSITYQQPSPPPKKAFVIITDEQFVGGAAEPTVVTTRIDCMEEQQVIVSKWPPITGTCEPLDPATGQRIYSWDPYKLMMWKVVPEGGSGVYSLYMWDFGNDAEFKTGLGGQSLPSSVTGKHNVKTTVPQNMIFYDKHGFKNHSVTVFDSDNTYPEPLGEIRCPSSGPKFYITPAGA